MVRLRVPASLEPVRALRTRGGLRRVVDGARLLLAPRRPLALVLAVAAPLLATLCKAQLAPLLGSDFAALPAITAVILVAWFVGLSGGLIATAVAVVGEAVAFMAPYGEPWAATGSDRIRLLLLAGTGLVISLLAGLRVRAQSRAAAAQQEAEVARDRADLAARRLEALQRLATELADAQTVEEILGALLHRARVALQADVCAAWAVDAGTGTPTLVASLGAGDADPVHPTGPDAMLILATVARTREPQFLETDATRGGGAVAAVPMRLRTGPGVLCFEWALAHALPVERQVFITALARVGAAALDRNRMFDAEVAALRRAEAATGYLDILADAGRTLGTTLDYDDLVHLLPTLGVPRLGDLGIVDLVEDGVVRRVVCTKDPGLSSAALVLERYPVSPGSMGNGVSALDAGRAAAFQFTDEVIERISRSPEHGEALRRLGPGWLLVLPIATQEGSVGALTFLRRGDLPFDPAELAVGEELGRRAGRALENTRLHQEVGRLADLERQFAELERQRAAEMEAVLGAVENGFLVADASGTIRSSNPAALRFLGGPVATVGELLGRLIDTSGKPPRELGSQPEELRIRDRPNAWVEITTYEVQPSDALAGPSKVIVCRDVTAFRHGQALREAFLGLLSHELRTPVTTIYAGAAVLVRRREELSRETVGEILADVAGEADRLYRLVEDLMVLARFDEGFDLGDQPVLLQHLVPLAVAQEAPRWPAVTFTCRADAELATVGGDETAIAQVVRNLLSNAAKYSGPSGAVEVWVRAEPDGVAVVVRDEGPGIDPSEAERIFDPFFRSPSTAGLASGAGIGLYVSRRLVDAMGGRITVSPSDSGGSEFTFVLPTYKADLAA